MQLNWKEKLILIKILFWLLFMLRQELNLDPFNLVAMRILVCWQVDLDQLLLKMLLLVAFLIIWNHLWNQTNCLDQMFILLKKVFSTRMIKADKEEILAIYKKWWVVVVFRQRSKKEGGLLDKCSLEICLNWV